MRLRVWDYMFIASVGCLVGCVTLIYLITVTVDTTYEPVVWALIFLGFGLFAGAYFYEQRYRKAHPEEFPPPALDKVGGRPNHLKPGATPSNR